jgi:hypothetical protein
VRRQCYDCPIFYFNRKYNYKGISALLSSGYATFKKLKLKVNIFGAEFEGGKEKMINNNDVNRE